MSIRLLVLLASLLVLMAGVAGAAPMAGGRDEQSGTRPAVAPAHDTEGTRSAGTCR